MSDPPQESSLPSKNATSPPLPVVMDYATPGPLPDAWQMVKAGLLRALGVILLLLSWLIVFYIIIAAFMMPYESADGHLVKHLMGVIAFLLLGVVLLITGVRCIRSKPRP